VRYFFGLMTAALGIAVACGVALTYDGAYYLFRVLEDGAVFVPNRRTLHGVLQAPVLLASQSTRDVFTLHLVFGASYVTVTLIALWASWWVVRRARPTLFVWPAFGVCLALLPGQITLISEGAMVIQLMWPVYLMLLSQPRLIYIPVAALLLFVTFFTHPTAPVLIGLAAVLAILSGLAQPTWRRGRLMAALALSVIAVGAWVRAASGLNPYEAEQLSLSMLGQRFTTSMLGLPLIMLLAAGVAALAVLGRRVPMRPGLAWLRPGAASRHLLLGALIIAGGAASLWAAVPFFWVDTLSFRFFVIPATLPFIAAAWLDSLGHEPAGDEARLRLHVAQAVGLIFALTLTIQSLYWLALTQRLRDQLATSPTPCLWMDSEALAWARGSALYHWAITPYAMLVQGEAPRALVLHQTDCAQVDLRTGFPIGYWEWRRWEGGWFDMSGLQQRIVPPAPPQTTSCWRCIR
jgi:hypothetical protein